MFLLFEWTGGGNYFSIGDFSLLWGGMRLYGMKLIEFFPFGCCADNPFSSRDNSLVYARRHMSEYCPHSRVVREGLFVFF